MSRVLLSVDEVSFKIAVVNLYSQEWERAVRIVHFWMYNITLLRPIYIKRQWRRCDISPKSNALFLNCTVTPSDSDVAPKWLCNPFGEGRRSDIADASLDVNGPLYFKIETPMEENGDSPSIEVKTENKRCRAERTEQGLFKCSGTCYHSFLSHQLILGVNESLTQPAIIIPHNLTQPKDLHTSPFLTKSFIVVSF